MNRRNFLLLALFTLSGCAGETYQKKTTREKPLPPRYDVQLTPVSGGHRIRIEVVRVDETVVMDCTDEFQRQYEISNPIETKVSDPIFWGLSSVVNIIGEATKLLKGEVPFVKEGDPKHLGTVKEEEAARKLRTLPDAARGLAIEFVGLNRRAMAKTNDQGVAEINLDVLVEDLGLDTVPDFLTISVWHNDLAQPVKGTFSLAAPIALSRQRRLQRQRAATLPEAVARTAIAPNNAMRQWFSVADFILDLLPDKKTMRKIARLYRKFARTKKALLIRRVLTLLAAETLIGIVVEEAFFLFLDAAFAYYEMDPEDPNV